MSTFDHAASEDAVGTAAQGRGTDAQRRSGSPEGRATRLWRKGAAADDGGRRRGSRSVVRSWLAAALTAVLSLGAVVVTAGSAEAVSIGNAAPFAVLAGSAVSNTNLTTVIGDLGTSPGASVTGFPPGTVSGTIHAGDSTAANAKSDVVAAYNDLAARPPDATVAAELGNTTKTPGVYNSTTGNFQINGTLTLDAQANPDDIFVFQAATLTAAMSSTITLTGGAQANNVYWVISDSATLNTFTTFRGNLIAANAISVNSRANAIGRLFTLNNSITITGATSQPPTLLQVPNDRPTTTTLSSNNNPSQVGQSITFTATVNPTSGTLVPQGDVAFKDDTTVLGTAFQSTTQPATFTTSSLAAGQHRITAVYLGGTTFDGENPVNFAPSTSPPINQVVTTSLWSSTDVPNVASHTDTSAVTVGVKFKSSINGIVTGVRFYKGSLNTGTHTGALWSSSGQLLANATFSGETASGWQQVKFTAPVAITANTTYVASYHTTSGRYSITRPYFTSQFVNSPLTALADGAEGGNGVYSYGATLTFPTSSFQATNYWVDPVFVPVRSLWSNTDVPDVASHTDTSAVTVGVKFRSSTSGTVTGIRFYKGSLNTGTHTGALWSSSGQLLANATFSGETASGWQQVNFTAPVAITANTTYVASYHTTSGRYSITRPYFTSQFVNSPLTALANGAEGGNGVYAYGATLAFPTSSYQSTNYWVDVVFSAD